MSVTPLPVSLTPDGDAGRQRYVPLAGRALQVAVVVLGAMTVLGLTGFALSFDNVARAARPSFGQLAPLVPLGIDLGILVFSATGLLLAYLNMPSRWLRLVPAGLTAVTIRLNVDGEYARAGWFGVVAHTALPLLWVVAVGVAEHVVKHRFKIDTGRRMDQVRFARWLLAPLTTFLLWRRMVLWEELNYVRALDRERQRLEFGARLRDRFGLLWRWRAPRHVRVLYRLELYPRAEDALGASAVKIVDSGSDRTGSDLQVDDAPADHDRSGARSDDRSDPGPDPGDRTGRTSDRTGRRTSRPTGSGGRSDPGRRTGPKRRVRSLDDLYAQLVGLVASGTLPDRPAAEAVRQALRCSATNARDVQRRYLAASSGDDVVVPADAEQDSSGDD